MTTPATEPTNNTAPAGGPPAQSTEPSSPAPEPTDPTAALTKAVEENTTLKGRLEALEKQHATASEGATQHKELVDAIKAGDYEKIVELGADPDKLLDYIVQKGEGPSELEKVQGQVKELREKLEAAEADKKQRDDQAALNKQLENCKTFVTDNEGYEFMKAMGDHARIFEGFNAAAEKAQKEGTDLKEIDAVAIAKDQEKELRENVKTNISSLKDVPAFVEMMQELGFKKIHKDPVPGEEEDDETADRLARSLLNAPKKEEVQRYSSKTAEESEEEATAAAVEEMRRVRAGSA